MRAPTAATAPRCLLSVLSVIIILFFLCSSINAQVVTRTALYDATNDPQWQIVPGRLEQQNAVGWAILDRTRNTTDGWFVLEVETSDRFEDQLQVRCQTRVLSSCTCCI